MSNIKFTYHIPKVLLVALKIYVYLSRWGQSRCVKAHNQSWTINRLWCLGGRARSSQFYYGGLHYLKDGVRCIIPDIREDCYFNYVDEHSHTLLAVIDVLAQFNVSILSQAPI